MNDPRNKKSDQPSLAHVPEMLRSYPDHLLYAVDPELEILVDNYNYRARQLKSSLQPADVVGGLIPMLLIWYFQKGTGQLAQIIRSKLEWEMACSIVMLVWVLGYVFLREWRKHQIKMKLQALSVIVAERRSEAIAVVKKRNSDPGAH